MPRPDALKKALSRTPQPGDVLLFYNATGLNRFIAWFTGSPFYHVALYAGQGDVIEARPRGVVRRNLRRREGGHDFLVVPTSEGAGKAALAWAEAKVGAGYDRLDILILILERIFLHLHINYTPRDKFACGEFVARAFEEAGEPLFPDKAAGEVVPGDFAHLLPDKEGVLAALRVRPLQK